MKGISKSLNKITHIFVPKEKEKELEIGGPTDVKHVAHIGSDGDAASPPSWMGGLNAGPEFSSLAVGSSTPARANPVDSNESVEAREPHKKHKRKKAKGHRHKKKTRPRTTMISRRRARERRLCIYVQTE